MNALSLNAETEQLQSRIHGDASKPTLIYCPGLHGDWTLVSSFRSAMSDKVRFVEFTYPRTLDWSLAKYAEEIENTLLANGITNGWLLGESFGSQVVWALAARNSQLESRSPDRRIDTNQRLANSEIVSPPSHFTIDGIILAGGFVKHPNAPGVALARHLSGSFPLPCVKAGLWCYSRYAKFRHRHAPETLAHIDEFVSRRTELDRQAMKHRLGLIGANDPRDVVQKTSFPVYALSGFWDPIVPRWLTKIWLQKNCASFREAKTIFNADHNVLGTAPQKSGIVITKWMKDGR